MSQQVQFEMRAKTDRNGDEYFVFAIDVPLTVDLSQVVLFVFPRAEGQNPMLSLRSKNVRPRHEDDQRRGDEDEDDRPVVQTRPASRTR